MLNIWCNTGSTWDNTIQAEEGKKQRSAKENEELIAKMCGVGFNATKKPEPKKPQLSKEAADNCKRAVNEAVMIAHPSADDQRKCTVCSEAVAIYMAKPVVTIHGKKYELDYCNKCMIIAEAKGTEFVHNVAACGCPVERYGKILDCKLCYITKNAEQRTCATCTKCGVDLGISQQLLGTAKAYVIMNYTCNKCRSKEICEKKCAFEGCVKTRKTPGTCNTSGEGRSKRQTKEMEKEVYL